MPITKQQFELGINAEIEQLMRDIAGFLEEHKEEAFTLEELWSLLDDSSEFSYPPNLSATELAHMPPPESEPQKAEAHRFAYALSKLVDHGVVHERMVRGGSYYALGVTRLTQVLKS